MIEDIYITPKPKFIDFSQNNGIRLSKLLNIYLNKHRIKDIALHVSSRFKKHFNVFLQTLPIKDSYINKEISKNHYFTCITSEFNYSNTVKSSLNKMVKDIIEEWEITLGNFNQSQKKGDNLRSPSENLNEKEGYYIQIRSEMIWLISKTETGFYNGIQTLIQIMDNSLFRHDDSEEFIIIPEMKVVDYPNNTSRIIDLEIPLENSKIKFEFVDKLIPFTGKLKLNEINVALKDSLIKKLKINAHPHKIKVSTGIKSPDMMNLIKIGIPDSEQAKFFQIFVNSELLWNFNETDDLLNKMDWKYLSRSILTNLFETNYNDINFEVQKLWNLTSKENIEFIETQIRNLVGNIFENEGIISGILKSLALKKHEFK